MTTSASKPLAALLGKRDYVVKNECREEGMAATKGRSKGRKRKTGTESKLQEKPPESLPARTRPSARQFDKCSSGRSKRGRFLSGQISDRIAAVLGAGRAERSS